MQKNALRVKAKFILLGLTLRLSILLFSNQPKLATVLLFFQIKTQRTPSTRWGLGVRRSIKEANSEKSLKTTK